MNNLAIGRTCAQSTTYGGYVAAYGVDDNLGSEQCTNNVANDWFKVDFGDLCTISRVVLYKAGATQPSNYKVQTADDYAFTTNVVDQYTGVNETELTHTIDFTPPLTNIRYIRVYCTATQYVNMKEFQVWGIVQAPAMKTYFANRASTPGGSGTTNDTVGADRAFATLSEAATVLSALNAMSDVEILCCGIAADNSYPQFGGTYVKSGYTLYIRGNPTDPNGAHQGYYDAQRYRLISDGVNATIRIGVATGQRIVLTRVQCVVTASGNLAVHINPTSAACTVRVEKCILLTTVGAHDLVWARSTVPGYHVEVVNCGFGSLGAGGTWSQAGILLGDFGATGNGPTATIRNCLVDGNASNYGITQYQGIATTVNCAVFDNNFADFFLSGGALGLGIDHCASDDGTGTNPIAVPSWPAQFFNPGYKTTGDFRLNPGSVLLAAGIGPAVDPLVPTDDIMEMSRGGPVASVGPFEHEEGWSPFIISGEIVGKGSISTAVEYDVIGSIAGKGLVSPVGITEIKSGRAVSLGRRAWTRNNFWSHAQEAFNDPSGVLKTYLDLVNAIAITSSKYAIGDKNPLQNWVFLPTYKYDDFTDQVFNEWWNPSFKVIFNFGEYPVGKYLLYGDGSSQRVTPDTVEIEGDFLFEFGIMFDSGFSTPPAIGISVHKFVGGLFVCMAYWFNDEIIFTTVFGSASVPCVRQAGKQIKFRIERKSGQIVGYYLYNGMSDWAKFAVSPYIEEASVNIRAFAPSQAPISPFFQESPEPQGGGSDWQESPLTQAERGGMGLDDSQEVAGT